MLFSCNPQGFAAMVRKGKLGLSPDLKIYLIRIGEVVTALRKLIEENSLQDMRDFLSALLHENITVSRHEMEDTNELPENSEIDYDDDGCASEELQSRLAVEPLGQKLDDGKRGLDNLWRFCPSDLTYLSRSLFRNIAGDTVRYVLCLVVFLSLKNEQSR